MLPNVSGTADLADHHHHYHNLHLHQKQQAAIKMRAKVKRFTVNKRNKKSDIHITMEKLKTWTSEITTNCLFKSHQQMGFIALITSVFRCFVCFPLTKRNHFS